MEEEKDDIDNEIVPKVKHKSGVGMAIVFVILSGIVFGAIGYWYGTKSISWMTNSCPTMPAPVSPPSLSGTPTKTPTISKTPSVVSTTASPTATASATVTATTSVGITQITN